MGLRSPWLRLVLPAVLAIVVAAWAPARLVGTDADATADARLDVIVPRAEVVAGAVMEGFDTTSFATGSARFDGEWTYGAHVMSILALSQVVMLHRDRADVAAIALPAIRRSAAALLRSETRAFATEAWGSDAFEALDDTTRGDAWLGYFALALGMARAVDPQFEHTDFHDALIRALGARVDSDPEGLPETYPGETYPPDVSACVGAIGLHARLTGGDASAIVSRWVARARDYAVDPDSGWLRQNEGGRGRGSGTALAVYFLAFADRQLSAQLFDALTGSGVRSVLGFAAIREHPPFSMPSGGDIDSGPVLFGVSVSATGFTLAGARIYEERALFRGIHRTASLFGVPAGGRYVTGGVLGDAILLAMETAGPMTLAPTLFAEGGP